MKLRNKKTGEIIELELGNYKNPTEKIVLVVNHEPKYRYNSLAELNEEWEDYEEKSSALDLMILTLINFIENEPDEDKVDLEDCKQMLEKLKAWKRLRDKGIKFLDWSPYKITNPNRDDYGECVFKIVFDIETYDSECDKDLGLLFGGEK